MGIHLTQVAPTGSVLAHAGSYRGLPEDPSGTGSAVLQRPGLPGVSVPPPLARGISVSALRREQDLAVAIRPLAVCRLRASGVGDGGNDFSGHEDAADGLVPRDVVDDEPEEREESCFIGSSSKLLLCSQQLTRPSSGPPKRIGPEATTYCGYLNEMDTPLSRFREEALQEAAQRS